jgi:hypothetical protein
VQELQDQNNVKKSLGKRLWIWLFRTILLIIICIIISIFLLRSSRVQTWLGSKITDYLENATGATISVQYIKLDPFNGIVMDNVFIGQSTTDTLIYGGDINISLRKNIFFLVNEELDMSYIGLKNFRLNIIQAYGDSLTNFERFLNKISKPKNNTAKRKPILLGIREIETSNIQVSVDNQNKGKKDIIYLKSGVIDIQNIDLECRDIFIHSLLLEAPKYQSITYNDNCNLEKEKSDAKQTPNEAYPWYVRIHSGGVMDGYFEIKNLFLPSSYPPANLDYKNFFFEKINLDFEDVDLIFKESLIAHLKSLSAKDNTGFAINKVSADTIIIDQNQISVRNYQLTMGKTNIGKQLTISYADISALKRFTHDVSINANFDNSTVFISDLEHFVPNLSKIKFVNNNRNEVIRLSGLYYGRINNLGGRDVDLKLGNKLALKGSFNTRDLLDPDNTLLNIRLDRMETKINYLKSIIPGFVPPQNFEKLGKIVFNGRFDGYYQDFVAYGKAKTDVGSVSMDMRLDITDGSEKARYSGNLSVNAFDLGRWSDNKDFGKVSFKSKVDDGYGLSLATVKAKLDANVSSLEYKNYTYHDFNIDGTIRKNTFDGGFEIHDENVDFVFNGNYEYLEEKSFLKFGANVNVIDFYALNLSKKPLTIKGRLDIKTVGNNINDFTGEISANKLFVASADSIFTLEKIKLSSNITINKDKELLVESDLGSIQVRGEYYLQDIIKSIKKIIHTNNPKVSEPWQSALNLSTKPQKFDFNIYIKDSKNFSHLLGVERGQIKDMALKGKVDSYRSDISIFTKAPYIGMGDQKFKNVDLILTSNSKRGDLALHIDSTYLGNKNFNPIDIQSKVLGDTISFVINTEKIIDSLESIDLSGMLIPNKGGFNIQFTDNQIQMLGKKWVINKGNSVYFAKNFIDIKNFELTDGYRSLKFDDFNNHRGITFELENINILGINVHLKFPQMKFSGLTKVIGSFDDLYSKDANIKIDLTIPDLLINDYNYGTVEVTALKPKDKPLAIDANIGDFLGVTGTYDFLSKTVDSKIKLRKASMQLIQFLLSSGIKETEGYLDGDFVFVGPINNPILKGKATIHKGATKVIYTGAKYYFDNQVVTLSNDYIDFSGAEIQDELGNKGYITGGLSHKLFKNFGVNATVRGANIIGLNTAAKDNPNYYGFGIGDIIAEFNGSFEQVDMNITAVTGPNTKLSIPVNTSQISLDKNFIQFVKRDSTFKSESTSKPFAIKGFNIEMSITLTPDALVEIIFDQTKGDIISGRGRGNLKVDITRLGDFEIFGDYEIENGSYLFTTALLPVAKPFAVSRGSRIRWTGDPINTSLDITAKYVTRTSISPFIEEYLTLASPEVQRLADQRSEVELNLKLGGRLYKPDIKFDLSFPNLPSEISSYTDNKLRILRNNELELNSQVVGLLAFKTFIPSNRVSDLFGSSGIGSAGITTLSEFVSGQLSMMVTNLINASLTENGLISNVDFEVGVRNNVDGLSFNQSTLFPDEVEVRLKNKFSFWDERLSLNLGGNYVFQSQGKAINQVLPDFAFELLLTDDRKMKIRFYGKYDIDPTINDRRIKYGLGVAYRSEFGSMLDFEKELKKAINSAIKN